MNDIINDKDIKEILAYFYIKLECRRISSTFCLLKKSKKIKCSFTL